MNWNETVPVRELYASLISRLSGTPWLVFKGNSQPSSRLTSTEKEIVWSFTVDFHFPAGFRQWVAREGVVLKNPSPLGRERWKLNLQHPLPARKCLKGWNIYAASNFDESFKDTPSSMERSPEYPHSFRTFFFLPFHGILIAPKWNRPIRRWYWKVIWIMPVNKKVYEYSGITRGIINNKLTDTV